MRYHVRTPDGELAYTSFREVELAYVQGLVGPEDEVREDGQKLWRKASTIPELVRARPPPGPAQTLRVRYAGTLALVIMGVWSLRLLFSEDLVKRGVGVCLALATSAILTHLTYRAFRRPKTTG
jgi:hypothetical protein